MYNLTEMDKKALERVHFIPMEIDAAYVNTLVNLINACRKEGVEINTVYHFQSGWYVTFKGFDDADAICHDHSYGSPNYMTAFLGKIRTTGYAKANGKQWVFHGIRIMRASAFTVLNTLRT